MASAPHAYWHCPPDLWLWPPLAASRCLGTRAGHPAPVGERQSQGRLPAPSAGCADRQRSKTAPPGEEVGLDGPKQSKGRTRPILVETLGLLVAVVGTAANRDDRLGWVTLWQRSCASGVPRLRQIWGEGGYEAQGLGDWGRGLQQTPKVELEVVEHTGKGLQVVQHRGQVERSHL
jgi:putative transposase